jgi:patatin-related protein
MAQDRSTKEIRVALVCYGGVSLAIYMHGVTKELFKLVRAARKFDEAYDADPTLHDVANPFAANPQVAGAPDFDSERAYFDAFVKLARAGHPRTVVLDVIAGTSAGGINGVCLARGLAQGYSLNGFRSLWIDEGDINTLLKGHALLPFGGQAKMLSKIFESVLRLEWEPTDAPLNGDRMSQLLRTALQDMKVPEPAPLVRDDGSLDLFTTTTSVFGYDTAIPTGIGGVSHTDRSYRQLMHFHYDREAARRAALDATAATDFASDFDDVPALAFAARATSSFPGAFPPVSLGSFARAISADTGTAPDIDAIARRFVYGLEFGAKIEDQWFMDGGVLDNGPFDHVIDAIAGKRASTETARELVYIEPDPGHGPSQAEVADQPTFAKTIWNARMTIPQHTPLTEVLTRMRTMNATIAEVGEIVRTQSPAVLALVAELGQQDDLRAAVSYADMVTHAEQIRAAAKDKTQLGYATYCRLRAGSVADTIAVTLARELGFPPRSNRSAFVASVLNAWMRHQPAWTTDDPQVLEAALGPLDIPFRLRRAEFVLQGINALFTAPRTTAAMRPQLRAMKTACWDLLSGLRGQARQIAAAVRAPADALFGANALSEDDVLVDPEVFLRSGAFGHAGQLAELYELYHRAALDVQVAGSSQALWDAFAKYTDGWADDVRAQLLVRYLGYPTWDSLIFPVIALAKLPQLSPITVQRFSPLDASCLRAVDEDGTLKADRQAKLAGVSIGHFGGFFKRSWRENDYLWGRLDGVELAMRLLTRQSDNEIDLTPGLRDGLREILAAETGALHDIKPVTRNLAGQLDTIKDGDLLPPPM